MTRAEKVHRARRFRDEGLLLREIGERMGVAVQTVHDWLNDPNGTKLRARKDSYRGTCQYCGEPTMGGNGPTKAPRQCTACFHERSRRWDAEIVLEAIRQFAARYGRPPVATDWNPAHARAVGRGEVADRFYEDGCWPLFTYVQFHFGSWNAGIEAAGFAPVRPGHYRRSVRRAVRPVQLAG